MTESTCEARRGLLCIAVLLMTWIAIAALAILVGLVNSLDLLRKSPLAVLREAD